MNNRKAAAKMWNEKADRSEQAVRNWNRMARNSNMAKDVRAEARRRAKAAQADADRERSAARSWAS